MREIGRQRVGRGPGRGWAVPIALLDGDRLGRASGLYWGRKRKVSRNARVRKNGSVALMIMDTEYLTKDVSRRRGLFEARGNR